MVSSSSSPKPSKKTRPVRSCTQCKQMKHGCDAKHTHPQPCSRCVAKGLDCFVDVQFRRTPTRERLSELNRELHTLRQSLKQKASRQSLASSQAAAVEGTHSVTFCDTESVLLNIEDARIGDCTLTRDELIPLFATFIFHFYKHLPIIDPSMTPKLMQRSSPFLFWTIIAIVIQRAHRSCVSHRSGVLEAYENLLAKAVFTTPLTLPTIQGLLYICTWPLAVEYQARDQSWNLIGMAVNAALYSGLHKSTHPHSLRSVGVFGDSPIRSTLWLACFYTSTWLSQSIGVPPTLRTPEDLTTIARITSDQAIPRHFAAISEIQICVAKYTVLISESSENHVAVSLERTFKYELDLTKDRFAACWDTDIECIFLTAKLHLVATLAVSQSKQLDAAGEGSSGTIQGSSLRVNLSEGFSSAIRLVQLLCLDQDTGQASNAHAIPANEIYMNALPKLYFRALVFAAFYLLRYHVSGPAVDGDLARSHVGTACSYLRKHSTDSTDEPGRAAAAIETLNRYSASKGMRAMRISDRMGASIFYDALAMASELRTKPVRLMSEQDEPQQRLGGSKPAERSESEFDDVRQGEDGGDSIGLPSEFMEDFDMEFGELSRDLFSEAAMFS